MGDPAMTLLIVLLGVLLLTAALGHFVEVRAASSAGLPTGELLFQDTGAGVSSCAKLVSPKHGLLGRPDYVIETPSGFVPVEIKSSPAPVLGPYENHVAQLMGYCLLVEDSPQRPVREGILLYRDGKEVRIAFTAERREWILGIIAAMREAQGGGPVGRSNEFANKCRGCVVRAVCGERTG